MTFSGRRLFFKIVLFQFHEEPRSNMLLRRALIELITIMCFALLPADQVKPIVKHQAVNMT